MEGAGFPALSPLERGPVPVALVQIQTLSGERAIWAKLSQAAKLVAQGKARYVVTVSPAELDTTTEIAAASIEVRADPPPATKPKKGRRS